LANLGIGAVEGTTMVLTVGSSAAVRLTSREAVFDDAGRAWCYPLDDRHFVVGEASNSGGLVLNWFAEILGFESAGSMTEELLPHTPYEPVDALLLPTLSGERAPGYQEELRGELIDLALSTSRSDLVTSAVEGIALFCRFIFDDVVRAVGSKPERTILTGSLGRARPIAQLAPVLFGPTAEREEIEQSSAIGAAVLAVAAHTGTDIDEVVSALPPLDSVESDSRPEFADYLEGKYERFADAYRVASGRIKAVEPAGPD
jgi:gluconokinase